MIFPMSLFISELAKHTIHDPIDWCSTHRSCRAFVKALKMVDDRSDYWQLNVRWIRDYETLCTRIVYKLNRIIIVYAKRQYSLVANGGYPVCPITLVSDKTPRSTT